MNQNYNEWLHLDIDQIEPKPLSAEQKAKLKEHVLTQKKAKKRYSVRFLAAAALLGASIATASFMTMPAIANQIPFIQRILTYFEEDTLPNSYEDLATVVNQVQSSNGLDIMIENAVYDGTNILLTYAIQTEYDLGDNPRPEGFLQVEPTSGSGGTGSLEKINDTTYVGVEKVTPHFNGESPEEIQVRWQPLLFKNNQTNEQFKGNWDFEFTLSQLPTNARLLNQTVKQNGITLVTKSLQQSEMTAVLQYEFFVEESILQELPFISIEMTQATDNLGNVYQLNGNGGISKDNGASNQWRTTIYSLNPDASSITLTPEAYYSKGSGEVLEVKKMKPITIDLK
ncbi:DUF4179 domain-containing protein [Mesobacillus foraminis]|uniref:DUF4179 domain-containing protein n=1 Tax=Mesobacillus foraminis TaxID=279826 RepID=UPI001BE56E66|nr:DUF4179 domain-containing protein [Mesobacillus foraminis]MBT2756761.1 DUF4179 domain-containing protein [Mesobacillus foraminis]